MRHITLCVTDEIYRRARISAAFAGVSVSAMVREFFESLEPIDDDPLMDLEAGLLPETLDDDPEPCEAEAVGDRSFPATARKRSPSSKRKQGATPPTPRQKLSNCETVPPFQARAQHPPSPPRARSVP